MSCRYEFEDFTVVSIGRPRRLLAFSTSSRTTGTNCQRALIVIILYTTTQIFVAWVDLNHRPRLDRAFAESFSFIASRALPTELHATLVAEVDLEPTCHSATAFPAPINLATLCGNRTRSRFTPASMVFEATRVLTVTPTASKSGIEYDDTRTRVKRICHNYSSPITETCVMDMTGASYLQTTSIPGVPFVFLSTFKCISSRFSAFFHAPIISPHEFSIEPESFAS